MVSLAPSKSHETVENRLGQDIKIPSLDRPSADILAPSQSFTPGPSNLDSKITPDLLAPSRTMYGTSGPNLNPQGVDDFFRSQTMGNPVREAAPDLRPTNMAKTKKNFVTQNKMYNTSMQRKKTRPNVYEKMTDKDKGEAYFRLQEENIQLKKDHTELEKSIKIMKNNFVRLEKGVKVDREMAEGYTGKDFKSTFIENSTNAEALQSENKLLMKENKILIKAALTGNLNKQLLSRIEGPSLNKFNMKPKVLSGAVMFDIKRETHSPHPRPTSPIHDDFYKIEYERLQLDYSELRKLYRAEQEKNIELENRLKSSHPVGNSDEVYELRERCKVLERQLAEALQSPFLKGDDSRLKLIQNEVFSSREKEKGLGAQLIALQEQIRVIGGERDKYKEDYLILFGRMQSKENYMNEFETQLRNIGGMDINAFMKALGLMKLRGEEPAWSQLDFLEQGTVVPNDLKGLHREVERLKLEKGQLAAEVEKAQSLLTLKNEMENEKSSMFSSEIEQLKIQLRSAQQRTEELARLADFRANRVIQLERNQRLNIYDEDNRIVGSKTQITVGELDNTAAEFVETGTEVAHNENILDLWIGEAEFYQSALEQTLRGQVSVIANFLTFLTVDFYNMETQTTSLCESLKPKYNIHISFKVNVSDFFIKTLENGYIYLETHASKADSHVSFARLQIPLNVLLQRSSAVSDINTKTGVVEAMSTYISNFDGKTSVGTQNYKMRMRYPLSEAMRWYREKEEIVELANPKQFALDTIYSYSGPTKSRVLTISVFRCMGLKGQVYPGNLRPFIYFQFFTEPESYSNLAVGPDPVYDSTFTYNLTTTPDLKKYLDTESLEIIVFDDNAPIKEGGQDILGTAKIPLSALLLDTAVEGTYMLYNFRGVESGKLAIRIAWRDSKADQIGYGTPMTQIWEKEAYERIAKALSSRGLGIDSGFRVFDQDQDGLISPQEFRNTILITLRLPLSEQEIQLLINACNLIEGGISKTLFRQKFSGLLPADRAIDSQDSWEETVLKKVRLRIQEKNLTVFQAFSAFDVNHDGFITSEEFMSTFRTMQLGLTNEEIIRILAYFDPRKTGRIDYKVFCDRVEKTGNDMSAEERILQRVRARIQEKNLSVSQAFSAFDENKDGFISAGEFIKTFKIMDLGLSDDEISKILAYFDPRKTGTIDYNIFCEKVSQRHESLEEKILQKVRERIKEKNLSARQAFLAFDDNKDGIISASEFIKAFRIMQLGISEEEIGKMLTYFDPTRSDKIDFHIFCDKVTGSPASTQRNANLSLEEKILERIRARIQEKNLSVQQAFVAFDENRDGFITSNEFIKTLRVMQLGLSEDEILKMLAYFDKNNSGKIDYKVFGEKVTRGTETYESAEDKILNKVRQRIKEKGLSIKQAFLAFDENRDGNISSLEFLKTFRSMELGLTDEEINKMMAHFDPRRTGTIQYEVFCDRLNQSVSQSISRSVSESAEEKILNQVQHRIQEKNLSIRQAFLAFDENRDGTISRNEFMKTFRSMELGLTDDEINKMFSYFDNKKTGNIEYSIFCDRIGRKNTPIERSGSGIDSRRNAPIERSATGADSLEEKIIVMIRERIKEKKMTVSQAFAVFDENHDGVITSQEFLSTFKTMQFGLTMEEISRMLAFFDPRKTGKIDFKVFCERIEGTSGGASIEEKILQRIRVRIQEKKLNLTQAFSLFDKNHDGVISTQEFINAFRTMQLGLSDEEVGQILLYFDPNRSGKINFKAFCERIEQPTESSLIEERILQMVRTRIKEKRISVSQTFAVIDKNKDRLISLAEFTEAFKIMDLGVTDEDIRKVFAYIDTRRTGTIDYNSFCDKVR